MDEISSRSLNHFPTAQQNNSHRTFGSDVINLTPKLIAPISERFSRIDSSITSTGAGTFLVSLTHRVRGRIKLNLDALVAQAPDDGSDRP